MVQVEEALSIIEQNCFKKNAKKIKVSKSLGYVLTEDVFSPIDMPPFRQSAMDGYAFLHSDLSSFELSATIQAGDFNNLEIKKNQAVRIFTGAPVPDAVDTVVMQEHTIKDGESLKITKMPNQFANVRPQGEQIKAGELALPKNTLITPASIGFLIGLGITEVFVFAKPKIAIVVTGNELVKAGQDLPLGKIYESNSIMLKSALIQVGIEKVKILSVEDDFEKTQKVLKKCISKFDMVLVSGGISVGDYDYVKEALLSNGVEELFYKINQKPGKPLFFGKTNKTLVFALPGNPASSLTCFYVYVLPAIKKMMGFESVHIPKINRKINVDFENATGKSLFLKGFFTDEKVEVLESQSSAMLNTFAVANGFVFIPYDCTIIKTNQEVVVLPFK